MSQLCLANKDTPDSPNEMMDGLNGASERRLTFVSSLNRPPFCQHSTSEARSQTAPENFLVNPGGGGSGGGGGGGGGGSGP